MKATGRDMQIARQIGEHLVVAELGRRGYVAAPFAGNVPMFDLLAADVHGFAFPVSGQNHQGAIMAVQCRQVPPHRDGRRRTAGARKSATRGD
jgi:hypothetical protein